MTLRIVRRKWNQKMMKSNLNSFQPVHPVQEKELKTVYSANSRKRNQDHHPHHNSRNLQVLGREELLIFHRDQFLSGVPAKSPSVFLSSHKIYINEQRQRKFSVTYKDALSSVESIVNMEVSRQKLAKLNCPRSVLTLKISVAISFGRCPVET
ncbi:hypothetical protein CEXT_684791 [Caerostris extrusa]|uniref:Ribosomal protein S10 n=1 Tax=Caerostris extrusa TaxID=172846 RepID=A0AAV4MPT0_CAEEX|nr:hypothetical protein CEXT_684791 [Caerostris extrusa]